MFDFHSKNYDIVEIDQISFRTLNHKIGRTIMQEGVSYLFFGGTAYLGLNTHPEMILLYKEGIERYGLNTGTSRNNNVQLGIYAEAERHLAAWFGFEESLIVSSGFLASQLAVRALGQDMDVFFAPGAHPALWLDHEQDLSDQTFLEWAVSTTAQINGGSRLRYVVASDTFASIRPSYYDFSPFSDIDDDKEVYFLLDDSHGFGVFENASIIYLRSLNKPNFHFIVVGSLAKGLGVDSGVVLGDAATLALLRKTPVYAGASPPSPAAMHMLINGTPIYTQQLQKLQERMKWFEERIQTDFHSAPGFPVYCFDDPDLYRRLLDHGIVISSFSYPRPSDPPLSRVTINSLHTKDDIQRLVEAIESIEY